MQKFSLYKCRAQVTFAFTALLWINSFSSNSFLSSIIPSSLSSNQVLAEDAPSTIAQANSSRTAEQIYQAALPSIVRVEALDGRIGTGSIISENGWILTNAHVVENFRAGDAVQITFSDGQRVRATILGFAPDGIDLAILQIPSAENLSALPIANSDEASPGQEIHIIGNPLGISRVINSGRVAGLENQIILLDVNGNPGNSGGPVLNNRGELIAVLTGAFFDTSGKDGSGIPYGIASNVVNTVLDIASEFGLSRISTLPSPQQIAINDLPVVNTLTSYHPRLENGSFYEKYEFQGRAGQEIIIDMSSDQVNPFLILTNSDGQVLETELGEGTTARLRLDLPSDGSYFVLASTDYGEETGDYRLQLMERGFRQPHNSGLILQERSFLGPLSPTLQSDNSYYRPHTFHAEAGDRIVISMDSDDFDTYLILFNSEGEMIDQNDDRSSASTNSELEITLSHSGNYTIYANTYQWVEQGSYTLTVLRVNRP